VPTNIGEIGTGVTTLQEVQMKRFILPLLLLLSLLFGIFFPAASFAEGDKSITILYTGFVKGNIDPLAT
jgi:4-hydroxybenzoate polyprenyltransferase